MTSFLSLRRLLAAPWQIVLCGLLTAWTSSALAATPDEIAELINRHLQARWEDEQTSPSPGCSDGEYLRRACLDLAGKIPTAGQARQFLDDPSPDKRRQLIDELLTSSNFVVHYSNVWSNLLVPEADSDFQLANISMELTSWLRLQLLNNVPYDEMVREILMVRLRGNGNRGAYAYYSNATDPTPTAFYAAKNTEPENLAAATARLFLGIRVDCAQCHDHPFAEWKQDQFWAYASFFQGLQRRRTGNPFDSLTDLFAGGATSEVSIIIPDTTRKVQAQFLNGDTPNLRGARPRRLVADWIVSRDNPYFAKAAVNRVWAHLLGRGIVDPVDDMDEMNPPSHPELLEELAAAFAEDFDIRNLIRGITLSQAYQRSSRLTDPGQEEPALFARFIPRRLDGDQVYASVQQALGQPTNPAQLQAFRGPNQQGAQFRRQFSASGSPVERTSSVQQALLMMNGDLSQQGTNLDSSALLGAISETPGLSDRDRVDALFLATLTRLPSEAERQRMIDHIRGHDDSKQGLADVFWALLNTAEFVVNH